MAVAIAALGAGMTVTACGTATIVGSEPEAPADPWVVPASSATRDALGVHYWGFRTIGGGTLSVRGYDEESRRLVEIRQRITETDPSHWVLDLAVARSSGTSGLRFMLGARRVEAGVEVTGDLAVDTLGSNPAARRVLDYLRSDARRGAVGEDTGPSTLEPRDLVIGFGGGSVTAGTEDPLVDEEDGGLTDDGDGDGLTSGGGQGSQGGQSGQSGQGGGKDKCQASTQCGGDMMSSLGPVLGMLGSSGSGLSSFVGIFDCVGSPDGAGEPASGLYDLARCAVEQQLGQQHPTGAAGIAAAPNEDATEALTQALSAFSSMQQAGVSCLCPP